MIEVYRDSNKMLFYKSRKRFLPFFFSKTTYSKVFCIPRKRFGTGLLKRLVKKLEVLIGIQYMYPYNLLVLYTVTINSA